MIDRWAGRGIVVAGLVAAGALTPPSGAELGELARRALRPVLLPFQWHALGEAERHGDTAEAFARAQLVLRLLPSWTDGHAVFAFRYALADSDAGSDPAARTSRAHARLQQALAWLESAREHAGRHEPELLQMLAFLPQVAVRQDPGLEAKLGPGGAAKLADDYLAEAERLRPTAATREQRTFALVRLAAGLLAADDAPRARDVLRTAIDRSHDVRDQPLAAAWRDRLVEAERWLGGDRTVDLTAVRDDPRLAPLLPYLR